MISIDLNELLNPNGFDRGLRVPSGAYEMRQGLQALLARGLQWTNSRIQAYPDPNQPNPAALSFIQDGQRLAAPLEVPEVALVWEALNEQLNMEELVEFGASGQPELDNDHLLALLDELPTVLDEMTESAGNDESGDGDESGDEGGDEDGGEDTEDDGEE